MRALNVAAEARDFVWNPVKELKVYGGVRSEDGYHVVESGEGIESSSTCQGRHPSLHAVESGEGIERAYFRNLFNAAYAISGIR